MAAARPCPTLAAPGWPCDGSGGVTGNGSGGRRMPCSRIAATSQDGQAKRLRRSLDRHAIGVMAFLNSRWEVSAKRLGKAGRLSLPADRIGTFVLIGKVCHQLCCGRKKRPFPQIGPPRDDCSLLKRAICKVRGAACEALAAVGPNAVTPVGSISLPSRLVSTRCSGIASEVATVVGIVAATGIAYRVE